MAGPAALRAATAAPTGAKSSIAQSLLQPGPGPAPAPAVPRAANPSVIGLAPVTHGNAADVPVYLC